jgi:hypothetical protein
MRILFLSVFLVLSGLTLNAGEVYQQVKYTVPQPVINSNEPVTEVDTGFVEKYFGVFSKVYGEIDDIQDCNIRIKGKRLKTTMAARPSFGSFFKRKGHRTYIVVFNNNPGFDGVKLSDVPENALTGLFAHELMHIRDYRGRSFFGLLKRGWQYLSKRGKIKLEHHIDNMTIEAGFGNELYNWSFFVLNHSVATDDYKDFKREVYMTPEEIQEKLKE